MSDRIVHKGYGVIPYNGETHHAESRKAYERMNVFSDIWRMKAMANRPEHEWKRALARYNYWFGRYYALANGLYQAIDDLLKSE